MNRIYHPWWLWEDYKYNFYNDIPPKGLTKKDCEIKYYKLLSNLNEFENYLNIIIREWKYSLEHNLSNENMNRIAYLGQACLARKYKIPSCFRSGFNLLNEKEQNSANNLAQIYLELWLNENN